MSEINFLMCIHCHQPADNFGFIFEKAYEQSYEPFLSVLERHPSIKVSFHYSGSLLDWVMKERPIFVQRVKKLIERKQIEILTGGYFEPVLSMVPERDAKGQIERHLKTTEKYFGFRPSGIWLAERVWDPAFSAIFTDLGIKYTVLDDFHLMMAGKTPDDIFGRYTVKGCSDFSVFASIKKLRYTMPFREPGVTIDFLKNVKDHHNARLAVFGDDCEKFGFWPHTYDWVYRKKNGWLERFFAALEENQWIKTGTFSEVREKTASLGEINIPHSSYAEMAGWCEGSFDNFFKRYPESGLMRERMLSVSRKIEEEEEKTAECGLLPGEKIEEAKNELYKSQANCAYWHGVFGGIYARHLRKGIYSHIIRAEEALGKTGAKPPAGETINSVTADKNVISAKNDFLNIFIDPDCGGTVFELDYKPLFYNLLSTMSRRRESYHEKLSGRGRLNIKQLKAKVDKDEPIDIHDLLGVRERNLKRFLYYDSYPKRSLLCHVMDPGTSLSDFVRSARGKGLGENGLMGPHGYHISKEGGRMIITLEPAEECFLGRERSRVRLKKSVTLTKEPEILANFSLTNTSSRAANFLFGIEFNWLIEDTAFMAQKRVRKLKNITLKDKYCNLTVRHFFKEPVELWAFPVFTLNESEKGMEKNFQGVSLLFCRRLCLKPGEKFFLESGIKVSE